MPVVKHYDAAYQQELVQRTEYESWLLDFFRARFLNQDEAPNSLTSFTLGDVTESGELLGRMTMTFVDSISDQAVKDTLGRFRVLAFTSAFKIQDMIAEWVLEANGEHLWQFSKKLKKYDQLLAATNLHEPPEFTQNTKLARAFWELYRGLERPRGAIIHTGKLKTFPDGTIEMEDRNGTAHRFDLKIQAAYIRFVWMVNAILSHQLDAHDYHEAVIENDLATLNSVHGIAGFRANSIRFEAVRVCVPKDHAKRLSPYTCEVDVPNLRSRMEKTCPTGPGGKLFLSLEVVAEAEGRELVWNLPPELLPQSSLVLQEDDASLHQYLEVRMQPAQ